MARNRTPGAIVYMDQVLAELAAQAPDAVLRGVPSAVHRARVATRRMGAAMQVLYPLADEEHWKLLGKALKRIRRSVQTLRDLDVMQEHLASFGAAGVYSAACELVRGAMAADRERVQGEVAGEANVEKWLAKTGYWMAVRGTLASREAEIQNLIRQALISQFAEFGAQADRLSEAILAGDGHHDVEPHALRIAGKSLRYAFEMADAEKMGTMAKALKRFKQLQDALGIWHDYHVLCARVLGACEEQLNGGRWHQDQRELILLGAHAHRESAKYLEQFARLWKKHREFLVSHIPAAAVAREEPQAAPPVDPATEGGANG